MRGIIGTMNPNSMKRHALAAAVISMLGFSAYWAARKAQSWAAQEISPFHRFLDEVDSALPRDARVLLVVPSSAVRGSHVYQLNTRLYPRVVYPLPPGVDTIEGAKGWIGEKKLTWAVSLGGPEYDPRAAYVRRLGDPH